MENLRATMARERVSIQDIADCLDVHRNTASAKVSGETEFSIQEAFRLRDRYFRQYSLEWLFAKIKFSKEAPQ